jgi:hypothetical protein
MNGLCQLYDLNGGCLWSSIRDGIVHLPPGSHETDDTTSRVSHNSHSRSMHNTLNVFRNISKLIAANHQSPSSSSSEPANVIIGGGREEVRRRKKRNFENLPKPLLPLSVVDVRRRMRLTRCDATFEVLI